MSWLLRMKRFKLRRKIEQIDQDMNAGVDRNMLEYNGIGYSDSRLGEPVCW